MDVRKSEAAACAWRDELQVARMARTGSFTFKSHRHSNCNFIIEAFSRGLCFLHCLGCLGCLIFVLETSLEHSRSDDHSSPDSNSVQHTVFRHLLQCQSVPDLTCSAKWRLLSGEKKKSLMGKQSPSHYIWANRQCTKDPEPNDRYSHRCWATLGVPCDEKTALAGGL